MTTTVLLVDDHAVVREGLRSLLSLSDEFDVVGEAGDGESAIGLARELAPDLVVLDLLMPGMDGVSATRAIRGASPRTHVVVLTSSDDDELAFAAIEAGAQSFLPKNLAGTTLLDALHDAARGEAIVHPFIARRILDLVRRLRDPAPNPFAHLTERELDVLRRLAEGGSNARIAATLGITEKTVKSHLGNVLAKLHLADRTEAVAFAWREGLMPRTRS